MTLPDALFCLDIAALRVPDDPTSNFLQYSRVGGDHLNVSFGGSSMLVAAASTPYNIT